MEKEKRKTNKINKPMEKEREYRMHTSGSLVGRNLITLETEIGLAIVNNIPIAFFFPSFLPIFV